MKIFKNILNYLKLIYKFTNRKNIILKPEKAYNLLSNTYDEQEFNLLNNFDQVISQHYINQIESSIENSLDFGAGTGRNIPFIKKHTKNNIFAYDISIEMLSKLEGKFPFVIIGKYATNKMLNIPDNSINLILCSLTIGYIENLKTVFSEWDRVLIPFGKIIITDLHSSMNPSGLNRSFNLNNKTLIIKSKNHSKLELNSLFKEFSWDVIDYTEYVINDSHKKYFDNEHSYRTLFGKKLLFSCFLQKPTIL